MCRPDDYPPFRLTDKDRAELRAEEAADDRMRAAQADWEEHLRELGPMAEDED